MDWHHAREGYHDLRVEASDWGRRVMAGMLESWKGFTPGGKIVTVASAVGIVFGVISGFPPALSAWDDNGLPTPATRGWVRDDNGQLKQLVAALNAKQADLQIDNVNGKIEATTAARNKLELDAISYDATGKIKAAQEMRRLDETIAALNEQKRAIRNPRGPR